MSKKWKPQNETYWQERKPDDPHLDWRIGEKDWIEGFWKSIEHPHRKLIIEALRRYYPFKSLLEVGCSCGPNLALIQKKYPKVELAGVDINLPSLYEGIKRLKKVLFISGRANRLPFENKKFDILLTDAVLIYIGPNKIRQTIKEFLRVTKKAMIFCEWQKFGNKLGEIEFWHWARDYSKLLTDFRLTARITKIPKGFWSTKSGNWEQLGAIIETHL